MEALMETLAEELHMERRRQRLTLRKLQTMTGVSYPIISLLEKGGRPQASFSVVARLAAALGLSLDRVITLAAKEHGRG